MRSDYTGKGVDQLIDVINTIKTNPDSRRIIMCAWNPKGTMITARLLGLTSFASY